MINYKDITEIKAIDTKEGIIDAYVSVFNVTDSDNDIIRKGAFAKTIMENGPGAKRPRIKHLWQHDMYQPIGVPVEMKEDEYGLFVRTKFGSDQPSRDKLQMHVDGIISEFSIGFNTVKQNITMDMPREILEVRLWEYSSVTWGANEMTGIVKSMDKPEALAALNKKMDACVKALRNGTYTDESFVEIEYTLKQIQALYTQLIEPTEEPEDHSKKQDTQEDEVIKILSNLKL